MTIALSVPSGFHVRELLLPLKPFFEQDTDLTKIVCICPAAEFREQLFPTYGPKFDFVTNPKTVSEHEQLLTNINPQLVITSTAGLDANDIPVLTAAKNLKLKTLTFVASWDNVWKMERLVNQQKPPVLADSLIVWNTMMRDHLLRVFPELSPEKIAIIGAPRFDYFWHQDKIPSETRLREYLGIPNDGKKLIHIATTELYPMDYLVKTVTEASAAHVYASVHPGGDMRKHAAYAQKYGITVRFSFGRQETSPHPDFRYNPSLEDVYRLVALFKYSDVLVNHSSTVAIESMAADVPIINVKYGRPLDWWRWYRSMVYRDFQQHYADITNGGATTIVTSPRQLRVALKRYLDHPELESAQRQATLKKMITTTDGTASQKMFAYIKQLCAVS